MRKVSKITTIMLVAVLLALFTNCTKDEQAQQAAFYLTDAPVDRTDIKAVFITVADIRLDGASVANFSGRKTLDVLALQNGQTELIGMADLDARAYSKLEIILDLEDNASGNGPGCYVELLNGTTHDLAEGFSASVVKITSAGLEVRELAENKFVIDFDLRKSIASSSAGNSEFSFVTDGELAAAVRAVVEAETGMISGEVESGLNSTERVVVYVYEEGQFDANAETNGQGPSGVTFANAVTSAKVAANGEYELHFLKEGDYELHFASYEEQNDGSLEFKGFLDVVAGLGMDTENVSVEAQSETTITVQAVGYL